MLPVAEDDPGGNVRGCWWAVFLGYGGKEYPPRRHTGPAPECRIEVSPSRPATVDYFLHVLRASDSETESVPRAALRLREQYVVAAVGPTQVAFTTDAVGGMIKLDDRRTKFANTIRAETSSATNEPPYWVLHG